MRNSTARPGEAIYLTKPIGNGTLVAAYRALSASALRKAISGTPVPDLGEATRWMVTLNRDAARIMVEVGVGSATDVTGYGLVGHLYEICCASGVGARIEASRVPLLSGVREYLARGHYPGGSARNLKAFREHVDLRATEDDLKIVCDAQTSGGLLMTVPADRCDLVERRFREEGVMLARLGETTPEAGRIELLP